MPCRRYGARCCSPRSCRRSRRGQALLAQSLGRLQALRTSIANEQAGLKADNERLAAERREIADLHQRKLELLRSAGGELEREVARVAALSRKAQSLRELIASLEVDRRKREPRPRPPPRPPTPRLRRKRRRGRPRSSPSFPLGERWNFRHKGQKLRAFGETDGIGGSAKGLFIATRQDAQVTAPASGRVEFAGPFRSYGQLLILDVGDGLSCAIGGPWNHQRSDRGSSSVQGSPSALWGLNRLAEL